MKSVKMQNVAQGSSSDSQKLEKVGVEHDHGKSSSTPQSSNSSPTKSDETYTLFQPRFMTDSSESEEDDVSEVESFVIDNSELDEDSRIAAKFLLSEDPEHTVDPETQARLEALLEAAGIGKLSAGDGKHLADPEVLRRLTSSVSCALDEAAAALTRMRNDNPRAQQPDTRSLVEACTDGDVGTVRKLLGEGRSVHETTEDGESLLSLACSAGYYELAQVLLAMQANVEDRGIKGDCTPLMEAASAGHVDIVRLLISHDAEVNAQSSTGNTPLMYACAGGHEEVVKVLLQAGANVEDHNENGHTPLMEAASAGYVNVAKILLEHGAGINTHSNEFKESALTLACYKGHLEMVRFLLEAGADQEHKTDEMHTALMEASMDGHVEVARLLLDSGAQVNMPTDSFESPLTLAACGGHVDLAMLLIERGANIEEVNDEGYTPLMEAAREGHEEMVALLLSQGANINAQTEETQETALTLACCGGFLEVADFLIKAEADIEAGASTPLMEASQEGHLELVKYLLAQGADVNRQTSTGDTALTYACENGHTDVAQLLIEYGADLEHESEGGRTPLMKACRAGHLCTVQFLISRNADVNKQTTNNDHTPLSLACAGGHISVVEYIMAHNADPFHKLKDNSTMLIEAAKGGHTAVVQLLLDYPHNVMIQPGHPQALAAAGQQPTASSTVPTPTPVTALPAAGPPALHQVPEAVRASEPPAVTAQQDHYQVATTSSSAATQPVSTVTKITPQQGMVLPGQGKIPIQKSVLRKFRPSNFAGDGAPAVPSGGESTVVAAGGDVSQDDSEVQKNMVRSASRTMQNELRAQEEQLLQKQILEELQKVEEELHVSTPHLLLGEPAPISGQSVSLDTQAPSSSTSSSSASPPAPKVKVLDIPLQKDYINISLPPLEMTFSSLATNMFPTLNAPTLPASFYGSPASKPPCVPQVEGLTPSASSFMASMASMPLIFQAASVTTSSSTTTTTTTTAPPPSIQNATVPTAAQILGDVPTSYQQASAGALGDSSTPSSLAANLSIQDRPKAKPVSKKDAKNRLSKQQLQAALQQHQLQHLQHLNQQLQAHVLGQAQAHQQQSGECSAAAVAAAAEAKQLLQQAGAEAQQAKQLLQQQAQTQQTLQQLHHIQTQLKQLEDAGINNTPQTHLHQLLQKQLRALQQQVPRSLVEFANRSLLTPDKVTLTSSKDDVGCCSAESHLEKDKIDHHCDTSVYPDTFNGPEEVLAAFEMHVDEKNFENRLENRLEKTFEKTLENYLNYQAVEDALNMSLHTGGQVQGQGQGQHTVGLAFPDPNSTPAAALQRLEYIPVKMQLKQDEMLAPGTSIQLSYQLPMVPTTVNLPASAFAPSISGEDSNLFSVAASAAPCQSTQAQLQAISTRLSNFKHKQLQLLPPQIAPLEGGVAVTTSGQQHATVSSTSSPASSGSNSSSCSNLSTASTVVAPTSPVPTSVSTTSTQAPASTPAVTQAATQTPNKKKTGKKTIWLPPSTTQGCRLVPTHPATQNSAMHQHASTQQPVQQQSVQTQPSPQQQQSFESDKMQPLISTQDVLQNYLDPNNGTMYPNGTVAPYSLPPCQQQFLGMDVDSETDSNHDTALTLGCAGGHEELVELLLSRGANIEHRDKKGFTPLILAATAGHEKVVEILLNHGADIEAQSERTKDTPLSLACSGGRIEVVNLLLSRSANKEHRNVSDYTPLSLAASGGYVNIIKLLLNAGAEINSRTGSKLGISPLMLAAMNGHTAAVKLLLDMGSDINAQIETNRNTALTLACFQGRHEVVSLLLDRKANVEHRAKTGLTPLMEAASGGYVEVGRVLLDKGADVNAPPVPSSRDTALTIAADKGHVRFVELLLSRGAQVEVKNKKGNSPLWLAANGGHLNVIELLSHGADIDSQDNRKVSCLMAAFRKGHVKAVKWMVNHVTQFPSDQEMSRYISTISVNEKELLDKCKECVQEIRAAKDMQAAKASMNADILLKELDMETTREESKRAAAARRRERKKKKKLEKKEERQALKQEDSAEPEPPIETPECPPERSNERNETADKEEGDSGIDANSQGSCSSNDVKSKEKRKDKKKKKSITPAPGSSKSDKENSPTPSPSVAGSSADTTCLVRPKPTAVAEVLPTPKENIRVIGSHSAPQESVRNPLPTTVVHNSNSPHAMSESNTGGSNKSRKAKCQLVFEATPRHPAERDDFEATGNETYTPSKGKKTTTYLSSNLSHYCDADLPSSGGKNSTSPKQGGKREEGWKEVVRKYVNSPFRSKKVMVPSNAISRVIGRGGSNINAIRTATGAHIEVDKQTKGNNERTITIKGSAEATKQAHMLISALVKDPEADLTHILPKSAKLAATSLAAAAAAWTQEGKQVVIAKGKNTKLVPLASTQMGGVITGVKQVTPTTAAGSTLPSTLAWLLETKQTKNEVAETLCSPAGPPSVAQVAAANPMSLVSALRANSSANKLAFPLPVARGGGTAPRLAAAAEKRAAAAAAAVAASNTKTTMSYTTAIMTAGRATKIVTTTTTQTFAAKLTETSASVAPGTSTSTTQSQSKQTRVGQHSASSQQHPIPQSPKHPPQSSTSTSRSSTAGIPSLIDSAPVSKPFLTDSNAVGSNTSNGPIVHAPSSNATNIAAPQVQVPGRNTPQQDPTNVVLVQSTPRSTAQAVAALGQYSLFCDSKPVWACENDSQSQKGSMNFASVAAAGASSTVSQNNNASKFLENVPPQVDAAKAPGYRGNTVSSPVSSKGSGSSSVASGYQNTTPSFSEQSLPTPVGMGNSATPGSKTGANGQHSVTRSASLAEVHMNQPPPSQQQQQPSGSAVPPVSQPDGQSFGRHMYTDRGDMSTSRSNSAVPPSHHHMMSSSTPTMMEPPPPTQHHCTIAPSPGSGFEHQPPPALLKMVHQQHQSSNQVTPPGSNLHHQDPQQSSAAAHHHNMMASYAPPPPPQPSSANLSHFNQAPMGSSSSSSSASLSPPGMHSRLNPRAPDFSSSLHMSGKQQPQQQGSNSSQQQTVPPPPSQQQQLQQHQVGVVPPLFNMPPSSANNGSSMNTLIMNQFKSMHHPSAASVSNTNAYHRSAPPSHHQGPPPQRWSMPPFPQPIHHQQDIMGFIAPGTNLSSLPPDLLNMENGGMSNHHGSPTAMSPSANNNSPPCGTGGPADPMATMANMAAMSKLIDAERRFPRPIGTERNWKNYASVNSVSDPEGWLAQDKMGGLTTSWAAAQGGPLDRHYRVGMPQNPMRLVPEDLTVLDNSYMGHPEAPHTFHNGGTGAPLSLMHGFMPYASSGLGPEVGCDMLSKMEAPSWDGSAARMGLADLPDKSQNWKWSQ